MCSKEGSKNFEGNDYKRQLVWKNIILLLFYHILALNGLYHVLTLHMQLKSFIWGFFLGTLSSQGVTSGAHRLWTHRSYKATFPLRLFLITCQTIASQNSVFDWARDHRVHHKFTDTDADPHNSTRGFFFSHMGWLLVRKHPEVISKGKTVDLSDLKADPLVVFQRKHFAPLTLLLAFVFPAVVPWYFWNESFIVAVSVPTMLRYILTLHFTWSVNSAAHLWGTRPYDKWIRPTENALVSFLTFGEGWHNYHHTFPWDYKAAELDTYTGNLSTAFIELMEKIGWAYDLKAATPEMVKKRVERTGWKEEEHPSLIESCENRNKKHLR